MKIEIDSFCTWQPTGY